MTQRAIFIHSS